MAHYPAFGDRTVNQSKRALLWRMVNAGERSSNHVAFMKQFTDSGCLLRNNEHTVSFLKELLHVFNKVLQLPGVAVRRGEGYWIILTMLSSPPGQDQTALYCIEIRFQLWIGEVRHWSIIRQFVFLHLLPARLLCLQVQFIG